MRRHLVIAAVMGLMAVVALWSVCLWQAARHLGLADDDPVFAVERLRRAATWHCPLNPFADEAVERLLARARAAEAEGRSSDALTTFRHLRYALLTSRSVVTPRPDALAVADRGIARLTHEARAQPLESVENALESAAARRPSRGLAVGAVVALVAWLGAVGRLLAGVVDPGRSIPHRRVATALVAVAAAAAFAWSLYLA